MSLKLAADLACSKAHDISRGKSVMERREEEPSSTAEICSRDEWEKQQ